ncbi:MAG: lipocalin family protein [Chlorobiaceae bacterium]|nr:lipocalin family protein [Chlorobiaceae bacterium]NTW74555.1 lipocalin family protein [Chlorobiaceae bacterium]
MFRKLFRKMSHLHGPETVQQVDVAKYCGTWYEISAIPIRQQARCTNTKAEYTLAPGGGKVIVRNSCRRGGRGEASVRATAVPVPGSGNAKLVVTFFRFFKADYWIIGLADDYSWALVSSPDRSHCWVLSRTPYPSEDLYGRLLDLLKEKGIDTSKLVRSGHSRA